MSDHRTGRSKDTFAKAAEQAVDKYEKWCKEKGKKPQGELEVDLSVSLEEGSSLSEYIVVLKADD